MKVGDLVMYKGSPKILGLIMGSHDTEVLIPFRKTVTLWHVHWIGAWGTGLDPVTHEEDYILEVFHGQD